MPFAPTIGLIYRTLLTEEMPYLGRANAIRPYNEWHLIHQRNAILTINY
jgi:hypothetical protein